MPGDNVVRHITYEEVRQLQRGDIIYEIGRYNYDGTARRWKVNGRVKTWVTMPDRIEVPLKHGLYMYGYLTDLNMCLFAAEEPPRLGRG